MKFSNGMWMSRQGLAVARAVLLPAGLRCREGNNGAEGASLPLPANGAYSFTLEA